MVCKIITPEPGKIYINRFLKQKGVRHVAAKHRWSLFLGIVPNRCHAGDGGT